MSDWQPGRPLLNEADYHQWQAWRKQRILEGQRARRAHLRRIDYYPSREAAKVIDASASHRNGTDYASVIDRLVLAAVDELPE
jgi:hypothetical protein